MGDGTTQSVLFPDLLTKPLHACFDEPRLTSDGGAVLLKAVDDEMGLTHRLADCVHDGREPGKVRHSVLDLLRQRIFGLTCGYPDANDVERIGGDPMQKLLLDRDPLGGDDLASQPTISRFENSAGVLQLYRMADALAATVIEQHRRRLPGRKARWVTIDLDPTDDPTQGSQQPTLFNGHYDCWCYAPLLGFLSFNDEPQQPLFAAILRRGTARPKEGTPGLLRRTVASLRLAFPFARVLVRLDGGLACPEVLSVLEELEVDYVVGMAENKVLARRSRRLMGQVRRQWRRGHQSRAYC